MIPSAQFAHAVYATRSDARAEDRVHSNQETLPEGSVGVCAQFAPEATIPSLGSGLLVVICL